MGTRCADHVTPLYPQKLALISPTGGGGRSVGIVRVRTKATEFSFKVADYHSVSDSAVEYHSASEKAVSYIIPYIISYHILCHVTSYIILSYHHISYHISYIIYHITSHS